MSNYSEVDHGGRHRVFGDDFSGRIFSEEWKCSGCDDWVQGDEVIWALDDGTLSSDRGNPWCDGCVPEQPEEEP